MSVSPQLIWTSFSTIFRREVRRFMRIWPQTLVPPVITMSLYFVIFGSLIGSRIGEMGGYSYMEFVVPGLIMMAVITNSYSNVVSSFYSAKFQRSVEELLVSPTPNWVVMSGYVLGGVARGLIVGFIVTVIALIFTSLTIQHIGLTILIVFMTSVLFALAGFINAIFANSFDDISIIPTFVLTPLTYLGGVFYSIELLSPFWQALSKLNPVLYMVNAFRYGVLGVSDINVAWAFAGVLLFIALLSGWALHLMRHGKRLRH
ncbi:ABC transporter permease [Microbulbifer agarilyticus]|uniref:Transport permease protein n=1 Tax=Microbulbifer agarilyticus TaxID=260552 RepID=A0A1Q2M3K4_9GAMM|nr:ABC transporter permease [Microbulbifer agarilyticus]AQQ67315.1 ABC transporter permease [Microbulbifer agarilyticus]MBY6189024.1 ABC transporter permease [Microbulbifer agarilyticus]MBY6212092.1 ABC transporter permease [Microbulbifer agarilyticus]MCA0893865.1 ABC transporter permease [Microbulbifer agarilyticus]MCA0901259.1 ABC transporter permease [Microbulbifer agarilyticus]